MTDDGPYARVLEDNHVCSRGAGGMIRNPVLNMLSLRCI